MSFLAAALAHSLRTPAAIRIDPIPESASPYPDSPLPNEFQYRGYDESDANDVHTRKIVHEVFADFPPMLSAAIASLRDASDDTFTRWFPTQFYGLENCTVTSLDYVEGVFEMLFYVDPRFPKSVVAGFVKERDDFSCLCVCDGRRSKVAAYFDTPSSRFYFCPSNYTMAASKIECAGLGHAISERMNSLTLKLVHEFLHSELIAEKAPSTLGHIGDVAYHPVACVRLAQGMDRQRAFLNADSYAWFATNAYYNKDWV
ncbi:hypothetical protein LTR95_001784 [Oleoguttula sp. CCFEE 5521]